MDMVNPTASVAGHDARRYGSLEIGLVALIALALRLIDLDFPPFVDELHHVLAGRALLETGAPTINEGGPYMRALPFTALVAASFALFGESLVAARIPSVVAGVLLVCLLFAWIRTEVGRPAAWTAAMLLCFAPIAVYVSQLARFYSLHALLFWLAAFGLYRLAAYAYPTRRKAWIGAASATALVLAFALQVITLGGAAGLALFGVLLGASPALEFARRRPRGSPLAGAAVAGLTLTVAALVALGGAEWLMMRMTTVDVWAMDNASNARFFHWLLTMNYGFLWHLFPLAALVALARHLKLALLFACVFVVVITGHSLSAWKAERYVYFAMPGFFAIWGVAASEAFSWVWARLGSSRIVPGATSAKLARAAVGGALALSTAFAFAGIDAYRHTRQMLVLRNAWTAPAGHLGEQYRGYPNWAAASVRLAPLADSVDVLIGEPDMKMVYYLGDVDYVLYASYLVRSTRNGQLDDVNPEFTEWRKVGRPVVTQPGSVELIMRCHSTGLIVAEKHVWGWRGGVPRPTADFIEAHTVSVPLPSEWKILAFRWNTPDPEISERCDRVAPARDSRSLRAGAVAGR